MGAIVMTRMTGPVSVVPASGQIITAGKVVIPSGTAGRGRNCNAAGTKVALGIAVTDGIAPEDLTTTPSSGVLNAAQTNTWADVAYGGIEVDGVKYGANAGFGDKLKSDANGDVVPMADADDPRLEVGTCSQPGGVLSGATGLVRTK